MSKVTKERYDIPVEPKAGKVGVLSVFLFGVLSVLVVFVAAYMWTDADTKLAGALGVASLLIPTTVGYSVSEIFHQRAGAFWFVITAAMLAGGMGAWAVNEQPDFDDRMDLLSPDSAAASFASHQPAT